jgi:hypothetical protein
MSENKKKFLPKLKKKIKGFLTEESWKISKKDALALSVGAALLAGVNESEAIHLNATVPDWRLWEAKFDADFTGTCNHSSWIVNWHYSWTPTLATINVNSVAHWSHGSHWSHASHGSHGSHWSRR